MKPKFTTEREFAITRTRESWELVNEAGQTDQERKEKHGMDAR
ncbi:hypothetical protein HanPI659440_Chr02g0081811 [Helianthus annuus]|nr:hypothetical protein HanPI659440_Chr02g0081811 [Helianthus annuus]